MSDGLKDIDEETYKWFADNFNEALAAIMKSSSAVAYKDVGEGELVLAQARDVIVLPEQEMYRDDLSAYSFLPPLRKTAGGGGSYGKVVDEMYFNKPVPERKERGLFRIVSAEYGLQEKVHELEKKIDGMGSNIESLLKEVGILRERLKQVNAIEKVKTFKLFYEMTHKEDQENGGVGGSADI